MKQVNGIVLLFMLLASCQRNKPASYSSNEPLRFDADEIRAHSDSLLPYCKAEQLHINTVDSVYKYYHNGRLLRVEEVLRVSGNTGRRVYRYYYDGKNTLATYPMMNAMSDSAANANPHFVMLFQDTSLVYFKTKQGFMLKHTDENKRKARFVLSRAMYHKQGSLPPS